MTFLSLPARLRLGESEGARTIETVLGSGYKWVGARHAVH